MEPETPRDRSSLRDVARFAAPAGMTTPAAKREARRATADSSGVVDLEALMKENPQWLDDALSRAKGQDRGSLSSSSSPALASAILAPPSLAPTAFDDVPVGVPKNNLALIAATVGALALIAGAATFALRSPSKAPPPPVAAANVIQGAAPESHAEDPIPPPPAAAEVANAAAPAAAAAPATEKEDDTAQANAADAPESDGAPGRHGRHGGHAVHHAALSHATAMAAAAPPPPPPPAAKPVKGGSALDAALRNAMGPAGSIPAVPGVGANAPAPAAAAAAPAAPVSSDRPERPSQGALTSAITGAMPAARSCVAGTSGPSHATITFGSNGNVRSVDLTGPAAADRKASSCVKSALNRAHVAPFSQSTYSAGVNIRP